MPIQRSQIANGPLYLPGVYDPGEKADLPWALISAVAFVLSVAIAVGEAVLA